MTVKPISITISTSAPISAGCTRSEASDPVTVKAPAATQATRRTQVGTSITARS